MAGGCAWQWGVCGRGCAWWGACMAVGHEAGRHAWQRRTGVAGGVCVAGGSCMARGHVWQGVCLRDRVGACMAHTTRYSQ